MNAELLKDFFKFYQTPSVENLTIGFASIDPPMKRNEDINHEDLDGLLGGKDNEHYHLTRHQLEKLKDIYRFFFFPTIAYGQEIQGVAGEEIVPYEVIGRNLKG